MQGDSVREMACANEAANWQLSPKGLWQGHVRREMYDGSLPREGRQ